MTRTLRVAAFTILRVPLVTSLALAALVGVGPAAAEDGASRPVVDVELDPVFVYQNGVLADPERALAGPGDVLGLAVVWPSDQRRAVRDVGIDPSASDEAHRGLVPRRVVAADRRAEGRDVVEVLVATFEEATLPPLVLTDAFGTVVARTAPLEIQLAEPAPATRTDAPPAAPDEAVRGPAPIGLDVGGLVLVATLLTGLVALAWWLVARGRRAETPPTPVPGSPVDLRSPDERALADLDALLARGHLERGELKAYAVGLAEIGKRYFGEIAGVALLERTTSECERALRRAGFPAREAAWLSGWLDGIDMIKFADARPATEELAESAETLRAKIVATRPTPAPTESTSASRPGAGGDRP